MKYRPKNVMISDAWHLNVNDRIHYFHLKATNDHCDLVPGVGHIYTDDLLTFTECNDILPILQEDKYPEDCMPKFTGCAFTHPDGTHYIYYTMRNKYLAQKIGVTMSKDLENFELYEGNPVLTPDSNIFLYGDGKQYEDCRDMLMVYDEKTAKYYGYFAAMAQENGREFGVIGVAESDDLINWNNQAISFKCNFDGTIEVPDVFYLDGKWYLTMLTHASFGAKYVFSDRNVVSGTIYAVADNPKGPFVLKDDNVFIGGTFNSGYTCRSFDYKGKKYVSYIDKSEYNWSVSLPKEIKVIDGKLRPCYTPILENLRKAKIVSSPVKQLLSPKSSTCFWNLGNGEATENDNIITIKTQKQSFQSYIINSPIVTGAEVCYSFTLNNSDGGIAIETIDVNEKKQTYFAVASAIDNSFTVYSEGVGFNPLCKRHFEFENGKSYHARILVYDGTIEVYINDELLIQNAFLTENMHIGLFIGAGECTFEDFCVYELN